MSIVRSAPLHQVQRALTWATATGATRLPFRVWLIAALTVWALLFALLDLRPIMYDEGIILTGAREVQFGAIPHRDFYANYGPAQFYVIAGLFNMFGTHFLVARIYEITVRAGIVMMTLIIARRCRPIIAAVVAGLILLWMLSIGAYEYPVFPALLLALIGSEILLAESEAGRLRPTICVTAGALTGGIALFRYDVGLFVLLSHLAAIGYAQMTNAVEDNTTTRLRKFVTAVLAYGSGTGVVFLPVAIALLIAGAGPGFLHDMVKFPAAYYALMRHLPPPGISDLIPPNPLLAIYLPFFVVFISPLLLFYCEHRRPAGTAPDRTIALTIVILATLCLGVLAKGMVRLSLVHLIMPIVIATLLLGFLLDRWGRWPYAWRVVLLPAAAAAVIAPVLMSGHLVRQMVRTDRGLSLTGWILGAGQGAQGIPAFLPSMTAAHVPVGSQCAIAIVRARTAPDEPVFVANMRHDRIVANRVEYYFEAERRPATHWYHFDPGLQTRADIQKAVIADLTRRKVRWIIRDSALDDIREPNGSSVSSKVFLLDQYLLRSFRPVAWFGSTSVWLRQDVDFAAPALRPECMASANESTNLLATWRTVAARAQASLPMPQ
jgi:hypothetical protein